MLSNKSLFPFMYIGNIGSGDLNEIQSGWCSCPNFSNLDNSPSAVSGGWGFIATFRSQYAMLQLLASMGSNTIRIRQGWDGVWKDWMQVSLT